MIVFPQKTSFPLTSVVKLVFVTIVSFRFLYCHERAKTFTQSLNGVLSSHAEQSLKELERGFGLGVRHRSSWVDSTFRNPS